MTQIAPLEFAEKWARRAFEVTEEQGYIEHFGDVARLVGGYVPGEPGAPQGLTVQAPVHKVGTQERGKADVYMPGHFIWEAKRAASDAGRERILGAALRQAVLYARDLGNPPLIVTTDFLEIHVHTNFTGTVARTFRVTLDDIAKNRHPVGAKISALDILRPVFHDPEQLNPRQSREVITTEAIGKVGEVARNLLARGHSKGEAAHFLMRLVFAMFSEDVGLLPKNLLKDVLQRSHKYPERSQGYFDELFRAMSSGGEFWGQDIRHFNGGLFDGQGGLGVTATDAKALLAAAELQWDEVEPSIFGHLFEESLEQKVRGQRGAHYTGVDDIIRVVEPVIMQDLLSKWDKVRKRAAKVTSGGRKSGRQEAISLLQDFQQHLASVRVLDPACGSGNFLYITLKRLLDLEHEVRLTAFAYGAGVLQMPPLVHPRQMLGIEIEPFAAELASVTLWIGHIQWKRAHGGEWADPVLERLDNIENADALLTPEGEERGWPAATYVVGNPPFLGDKVMRGRLGDAYVERLRGAYGDRLPGGSDLVCYWPEKARAMIEAGATRRAGFVTTNSIRGGKNRVVLERIKASGDIFMAWPDEPWLQDGAAVRVSLFAFDGGSETEKWLNGESVAEIHADLSVGADVSGAVPLAENIGIAFVGGMKKGKFDIMPAQAQALLSLPNPDGRSNVDIILPWVNGMDLTRRPRGMYIIDFAEMSEEEASGYLEPFEYVRATVKPEREKVQNRLERERWWLHGRSAPDLRAAIKGLPRFIGIPRVAKHLLPVWLTEGTIADGQVVVIARDDHFAFGILNSALHRWWAHNTGTFMGVGNDLRYSVQKCFQTFPFPHPTPEQHAEVEKWAVYLHTVRQHLLAQDSKATLTGLYNALQEYRADGDPKSLVAPLATAHDRLDQAVAAAYGWEWPFAEDEMLGRLLALNWERAGM